MTQTAYNHLTREQLIGALERRDSTLQAILNVIHLPNKDMAPGEKLFWIAAQSVLMNEQSNEQGLTRLPLDDIAKFNGMSESSNSRYKEALIERYGATAETVPYVTKKGQKHDLTYIDRSQPFWQAPWRIDLPEEKQRVLNGNGKFCEHCKTYNLQVTTHRLTYQEVQECECCGYKKVSKVLNDPDNVELPPSEYIPDKKGPQAGEPFSAPESSEPQKASQAEEPFGKTAEKLRDPQTSVYPSTPPDVEAFAAQILLAVAGEHTSHIEMCRDGDAKYITRARSLNLGDLRTHLRGYKTKGVVNRSDEGMTRAIWFEGDSPEQWQRCKEAARLLKIMDFKILLSPSPTTGKHAGGGHLWIVFDGLVDAYSALQTVYQYTGNLLRDLEHWPGGGRNARLPGGKYIYQCDAWCNLYDADGNELSHDGASAAALLAHQTSIEVVNSYIRPAPVPEPERTKLALVHGGYLEKDLARQAIADFNASHSWAEIVGGFNRDGKFEASWRGDRNPNCSVNPNTDLAKDFSTNAWFTHAFDKYDCWCLIEGGQNWEAFKRDDLKRRCAQLREAQGPEPTPIQDEPSQLFEAPPIARQPFSQSGLPTRMTYCCNVPFQHGPHGPECSNPACPEKQREQEVAV